MSSLNDRPQAPDPYDLLPQVDSFVLTSSSFEDGAQLPYSASAAGGSHSPQLAWSGFPARTKSFLVTCYDPDAPTPSGYWHWVLVNVSPTCTQLAADTGTQAGCTPGNSFHCRNDAGQAAYFGAAPPPGDRPHRYIFAVSALDIEKLEVDADTTAATVCFQALTHTLARATLTGYFQAQG